MAADKDVARREALILIREEKTRSRGFDALASLSETTQDWRRLGELAYPWDTARASLAYDKTIETGSNKVWDYIYLARLYQRGANLDAAGRILLQAQKLDITQRESMVLGIEFGDVARAQGDLTAARTAYEDGLKIRDTLSQSDPTNTEFQRDLMVSHVKLAQLVGEDAASHWQSAYNVLETLNVAGKMQPADQEILEFLENMIKAP